ncbi:hypothetical protein LCGC14_1154840 [marine sediment metagenome]|uniref:Uncharacterized protein n=1 Tax=marine sediment metagenome TaxID=412755 RepID=A0A0F9LZ80_9ZZZZ
MEAKTWEDMVMSPEKRRAINDEMPSDAKYGDVFEAIAKAQAEITWKARDPEIKEAFKAGQEAEKAHWAREIERQLHDAYEGGLLEVVEWVKNNITIPYPVGSVGYIRWQAKLKEWGIEDWEQGSEETRESLAKGHGITFPTGEEAINWLTDGGREMDIREEIGNVFVLFYYKNGVIEL